MSDTRSYENQMDAQGNELGHTVEQAPPENLPADSEGNAFLGSSSGSRLESQVPQDEEPSRQAFSSDDLRNIDAICEELYMGMTDNVSAQQYDENFISNPLSGPSNSWSPAQSPGIASAPLTSPTPVQFRASPVPFEVENTPIPSHQVPSGVLTAPQTPEDRMIVDFANFLITDKFLRHLTPQRCAAEAARRREQSAAGHASYPIVAPQAQQPWHGPTIFNGRPYVRASPNLTPLPQRNYQVTPDFAQYPQQSGNQMSPDPGPPGVHDSDPGHYLPQFDDAYDSDESALTDASNPPLASGQDYSTEEKKRRREKENRWLVRLRRQGKSYQEILAIFGEKRRDATLSTLRGRHRNATKSLAERPRKPVWTVQGINTLRELVDHHALRTNDFNAKDEKARLAKVPWKQVAEEMARRGHHKFGNAAVKKKYLEVMNNRPQPRPYL